MTSPLLDSQTGPHATQPPRPAGSLRRARRRGTDGGSLIARGEPVVWLHAAGLVICLAMILGLLGLILYQGASTFWPGPLVQYGTSSGETFLGEQIRREEYRIGYENLDAISGPAAETIAAELHALLWNELQQLLDARRLERFVQQHGDSLNEAMLNALRLAPAVQEAPALQRGELLRTAQAAVVQYQASADWQAPLRAAVHADSSGGRLYQYWSDCQTGRAAWLQRPEAAAMLQALRTDRQLAGQLWQHQLLSRLADDVSVPMHRRLLRTGNFELSGEHFHWISDYELEEGGRQTRPEWALLFERQTWGRFYGLPAELKIHGQAVAREPAEIWSTFRQHHPEVRRRWQQARQLERVEAGDINRRLEEGRLQLRQIELRSGRESPAWQAADQSLQILQRQLEQQYAAIHEQIRQLDETNAGCELLVRTAGGQTATLPLAEIVRAVPANRLDLFQRLTVYLSRWGEFLTAEPREANSEGGVFPAIWGTVTMTLLMSLAVVPFGVLAALYLREYARPGLLVSTVRIAVNNLAGVPSIVYGVFGLGFFCYILGVTLDQLLFEAKLPSPTFGTGGLLWASLTLALLTLPVVIVATEEALAAVPRSMREGSLACGASKWQTIRRIVLPRALPGIMTGMILAMARGAGEVAPLMLVGAVKLAPELPVDGVFPYVHLERSFMHLGFHIYDLGFQSQNSEAAKPAVFTTTLLLILLIAALNATAMWLRAKLQKRFVGSAF